MYVHFREEATPAVDVALLVRSCTPWQTMRCLAESRMRAVRTNTRIEARSAVLAGLGQVAAGNTVVVPAAGN